LLNKLETVKLNHAPRSANKMAYEHAPRSANKMANAPVNLTVTLALGQKKG